MRNVVTRSFVSRLTPARKFSANAKVQEVLARLGVDKVQPGAFYGVWTGDKSSSNKQYNPSTGEVIGEVQFGTLSDYQAAIAEMDKVKVAWADTPAPVRGEVVRKIGEKLRQHKEDLGFMVSLEMGKILTEGLGEIQEAIDICDYAVGLARNLNGKVIPSERPGHIMMERYSPLKGHVGIITAFNFPVAVYFWNLAISLVAGNTNLWKPHESLSLTSVATTKIVAEVLRECNQPGAIASMVCGAGSTVGHALVADPKVELVSFTGSTERGREVAKLVAGRFGKHILELGGNNAQIVDQSADLDMALRATLFGAVGTAGQRCTTLRRLYLHKNIHDAFVAKLVPAYKSVKIGSPLDPATLCGPLHNAQAVQTFQRTVSEAVAQGGKVLVGGEVLPGKGHFVQPTVISIAPGAPVTKHERFVPILYVMAIDDVCQGIELNNNVSQGLSSSLFTQDLGQIFHWTGPNGSDCGIVNVSSL